MRWFPAMLCHAGPSSLFFFFVVVVLWDVKFSQIVIYRSKFRRMDCYILYGGLHCDSKYYSTEGQTFYWSIMTADESIKCRCANSGMNRPSRRFSKSRGLSANVSFMFPSFLPHPVPALLLAPVTYRNNQEMPVNKA